MAGRSSIAGAWVLDLSRSHTLGEYLRCMRVSPPGIEAQVMGEQTQQSINVIGIDELRLIVHKRTSINEFTETFELGEEKITSTKHGSKRSLACLRDWGSDGLVITTSTPTPGGEVHLVETRQLMAGGNAHAQELHLHNLTTGEESSTLRTWTRVAMTQQYQASLADE